MEDELDVNDVMTVSEVARWLKMKPSAIYRLTASKQIPHKKRGPLVRFSRRDLKAWWSALDVPLEAKPSKARFRPPLALLQHVLGVGEHV
jgi:excisionase family DNA binding protein